MKMFYKTLFFSTLIILSCLSCSNKEQSISNTSDAALMKDTIISYDLENISSEGTEAIVTYKNRIATKATINIYGETGKIIITYLFNKNIISVQEEIISYISLLNEDSLEVIPISKISYFLDYKGHFKGKKRIRYTDIFKSFMETVPLKI